MIKVDNQEIEAKGNLVDVIAELGYLCGALMHEKMDSKRDKKYNAAVRKLFMYSIIQGTILGCLSNEQAEKVTRTAEGDFDKITYEIRNAFNVAIEWGNKI